MKFDSINHVLSFIAAILIPIPCFIEFVFWWMSWEIHGFLEGVLLALVSLGITSVLFQFFVLEKFKEIEESESISTINSLLEIYKINLTKELCMVCDLRNSNLEVRASMLGQKGVQAINGYEMTKALKKFGLLDNQSLDSVQIRCYGGLISEYQKMISVFPTLVLMLKVNTEIGQIYRNKLLEVIKHDDKIQRVIKQSENLEFSITSDKFVDETEDINKLLENAVYALYANIIFILYKVELFSS